MKFKAKSMLAMAVLLSVMSVGTMAEAEWRYKVDDGVEQIWDGSSDLIGSSNKLEVWSSTGSDLSGKFICGSYDGHSKTVIFKSGLVSSVYGGKTNASIVVGNTVNISGGYVGVGVYGGYCDNNCDAIGNTVIISNGTLTGDVYGGYSFLGGQVYRNKVIISGGNLSDAKVYGYGGNGLSFSNDNTLQIENSVTVNKIGNFENISFVLPSISGDKTLLSLTNAFSMTGENVRVNLGYNTNSTLNSYNVTLANNVSGAFDVTYYDKDGAGYVEEFSIASAGDLKIGEGTKMRVGYDLTTDAGELLGKQDTLYVDSGIKLTFASGTLEKNIAGTGTTEFNNTVSVANDVNLGTSTNNVNDTLDVLEHITTGNINFKNGSTLKVDGTKIISAAAITGITSATVESGAKLYVSNAEKDTPYKILSGTGINVSGWQTDVEMDDVFRAIYGLVADTDNITNNSNEFTIQFKMDPSVFDKLDIPNVFVHKPMGSTLQKFVENISLSNPYKSATVINTMANMNSLANVQQGTQAVMAMATDALQTNIGTGARPMLGDRGQVSGVRKSGGMRNVAANAKDTGKIETVEQGKSDEVMPVTVENEPQKYDKTVWANYIHSKKTIDGLKTGRLTQNSTIQYNGVTVGADLWSNAKGFGGLALTTAEGKTNSSQDGASVKNDTDYHGVSLYQRYDYKDVALLFDLSYTHAKNDVTMSTAGTTDVTAKPKSDAYSAGVKVEYPVKVGRSQLTPYAGLRYTRVHTGKYENSLGISNDIKDQNLVNIPIGVQLKTEFETQREWKFGNIFEGGYVLNIGNRKSEQRLGYQGVYDSIDFDVTDRGEYFLKTGFTAKHKDTDFELGYRYTRGANTKDNKWNFNVTHNFGNANGMPYKSVLLGKIDLLENANKALRAENVELKAENERKDLELAEVKAENERLKALLENK